MTFDILLKPKYMSAKRRVLLLILPPRFECSGAREMWLELRGGRAVIETRSIKEASRRKRVSGDKKSNGVGIPNLKASFPFYSSPSPSMMLERVLCIQSRIGCCKHEGGDTDANS